MIDAELVDVFLPATRRRAPVRWTDPLVIAGAAALVVAAVVVFISPELLR